MANLRHITLSCDPEWDDEVDVVITDTGMAGWATAISAVDEEAEVFLADAAIAPSTPDEALRGCWFDFGDDEATAEYRGELTADLDLAALTRHDPDLPVRLAGELVGVRQRPRPTFDGAALRDWTARCIPAPSGYLYTRVTEWTSELMDCGDGQLFKVSELGSMTPDRQDPVGSVVEWLTAEALDRGVSASPVRSFERLVFEDGAVTGAVFSTEDGPLAIAARHGVLICRRQSATTDAFYRQLPCDTALRIALVGKDASRFGRVELLTSDAGIADSASGASPRATAVTA